ncbi:hypothetical protein NHX12_002464, partial [Muraenolepis orangiensis]
KKEHEGFGFVLRGAKAFPALQYLESVDVEGVAWRAGLRTGDFLIEGGSRLLMKVVSVTRKPETEDVVRKKEYLQPKKEQSEDV